MTSILLVAPLAILPLFIPIWGSAPATTAEDGETVPPACSICVDKSPAANAPFGPHTGLGTWLKVTVSLSSTGGDCEWQPVVPQVQPPMEECTKLRKACKFWGSIKLQITDAAGGSVGNLVPDPNGANPPKWVNSASQEWTLAVGTQQNKHELKCGTDLPISFEATPTGTTVALKIDLTVSCTKCSGLNQNID